MRGWTPKKLINSVLQWERFCISQLTGGIFNTAFDIWLNEWQSVRDFPKLEFDM